MYAVYQQKYVIAVPKTDLNSVFIPNANPELSTSNILGGISGVV